MFDVGGSVRVVIGTFFSKNFWGICFGYRSLKFGRIIFNFLFKRRFWTRGRECSFFMKEFVVLLRGMKLFFQSWRSIFLISKCWWWGIFVSSCCSSWFFGKSSWKVSFIIYILIGRILLWLELFLLSVEWIAIIGLSSWLITIKFIWSFGEVLLLRVLKGVIFLLGILKGLSVLLRALEGSIILFRSMKRWMILLRAICTVISKSWVFFSFTFFTLKEKQMRSKLKKMRIEAKKVFLSRDELKIKNYAFREIWNKSFCKSTAKTKVFFDIVAEKEKVVYRT